MNKRIAVILVNWNSFELTADCIRSLGAMDQSDHDILVVDNGSEDGSVDKFNQQFHHIILIKSTTNRGFTGGNNLGIEYALGKGYEYVFLLNNDTFVQKDVLTVLTRYMDAHPGTGAIQPLIYFNHNRTLVWNGGSFYNRWIGHSYVKGYNRPLGSHTNQVKQVDWITGCAFFIRSAILKDTGPFAENMFMYYEDVELSFRIRQCGHKLVYHPGTCVYHIAGMSNRNKVKNKEGFVNPIVHYLNIRNRIWLLKKYTGPLQALPVMIFNFFYLAPILAYFLLRRRFSKLRSVCKGIRDGFRDRIRP